MITTITTILNIYKRNHIEEQIQAIECQKDNVWNKIISDIWIVNNWDIEIPKDIKKKYKVIDNNYNWWVRFRFIIGIHATTEYICWFDDDTIPWDKRYSNCLKCINKKDGLYWTVWHIYSSIASRRPYTWHWRANPNNNTKKVDIVWHSWFMKRKYLGYIYNDIPPLDKRPYNGEDMRLSFNIQKLWLNTYVPPHPKDNKQLRWSIKWMEYWTKKASCVDKQNLYNDAYLRYIQNWFKIICW